MDLPRLTMDGVWKRFGRRTILQGVDLELEPGDQIALLGGNGAGKTTTLRVAAGLLRPTRGRVAVDGLPLTARRRRVLGIGYCPQANVLYPELTVEENIAYAARVHGVPRWKRHGAISAMLSRLDLHAQARIRGDHLSGGQQRRLTLACSAVHQPGLLFVEEPEAGVDPETRAVVGRFLRDQEATLLWTTHDLDLATRADRTVHLVDGLLQDTPAPAYDAIAAPAMRTGLHVGGA